VLNEDRILRRYWDLIKATLRTNFYQTDANGQNKSYFCFKFNPPPSTSCPSRCRSSKSSSTRRVSKACTCFGNVARGGLRWSTVKKTSVPKCWVW
jgi:glutamate dehydrogenase